MHIAPPPSGSFLKTMYVAIRGQGALQLSKVRGSDASSMQPLVHDQPQPACDSPKNNSAERHGGEHDRPEE